MNIFTQIRRLKRVLILRGSFLGPCFLTSHRADQLEFSSERDVIEAELNYSLLILVSL